MASSTMPSRRAHSQPISSSMPARSRTVRASRAPAGSRSARRASTPGRSARSAEVIPRRSWVTASSSWVVTVIWLTDGGRGPPRRAAARAMSVSRVPLLPDRDPGTEAGDLGEHPPDRGGHGVHDPPPVTAGGRVAADQVGGHPPDAELEAGGPGHPLGVADHQLEAAAPEVEGQGRGGIDDDAGAHGLEDQARLLPPADHPDLDAGLGLDAVDDRSRVAGVAEGGGGAGDHLVHLEGVGEGPEAPDHLDRRRCRHLTDLAGVGDDAAEPEHLLVADEGLEGPVGVGIGDQQVERVAAEVQRRYPHVCRPYTPKADPHGER